MFLNDKWWVTLCFECCISVFLGRHLSTDYRWKTASWPTLMNLQQCLLMCTISGKQKQQINKYCSVVNNTMRQDFTVLESYHRSKYTIFNHNNHEVNSRKTFLALQSYLPAMCTCRLLGYTPLWQQLRHDWLSVPLVGTPTEQTQWSHSNEWGGCIFLF